MIDIQSALTKLDISWLADLAWRIISEDTVQDARQAAQKIDELTDLVQAAAKRILGIVEDGDQPAARARSLDYDRRVDRLVAQYTSAQED